MTTESKESLKFALACALLIGITLTVFTRISWGQATVTYTDATGAVTDTKPLPQDGRFNYRIQTAPDNALYLATHSVEVTDDTGQMAAGCYPIDAGMTIAVTSEVVVAAQPIVTVTGQAFYSADCTGAKSGPSNPITVEFVPEVPALLGPLSQ